MMHLRCSYNARDARGYQLSSPTASDVASSEVSAIAEVKFAPLAAQVNNSIWRT